MLKPIERKSPAWRRGKRKGEDYGKENPTPILSFQQAKICQNCRYFADFVGVMTALSACRITGRKVLGSYKACELFTPCGDSASEFHLTPDSFKGKLGFPNFARLAVAFGFSPKSQKLTVFSFFARFPRLFQAAVRIGEKVRLGFREGRVALQKPGSEFSRLFSCPKTAN